jgi:hypothetical protein
MLQLEVVLFILPNVIEEDAAKDLSKYLAVRIL